MIVRERAIDAGAFSGAAVLVVVAWWVAGQMREHSGSVPVARPDTTVIVTQAPLPVAAPPATTTVAPTPSPSTSGPRPAARILAAERTEAMPHAGSGGFSRADDRLPSAPHPSSTIAQQLRSAAACDGQVLTVRIDRACVSLGGSQ